MPSVFNYPMYYTIKDVFGSKMDMRAIPDRLIQCRSNFADTRLLGVFIDNHDNPRFLSQQPDIVLLHNALTFALMTDGIPFIYYGTEQLFKGSDDPRNREPLWTSKFNENTETYALISQLNQLRRMQGPEFFNSLHTPLVTSSNIHVFLKGNLIVIVSNIGTSANLTQKVYLGNIKAIMFEAKILKHAFLPETVAIDSENTATIRIHNGQPLIYYLESY
jgi:alpha-amylase